MRRDIMTGKQQYKGKNKKQKFKKLECLMTMEDDKYDLSNK